MARTKNFLGVEARVMKPTQNHRPAVWECILGAVYAMNEEREVEYFDYKYEEALEFAGVSADRDPRVFKNKNPLSWAVKGMSPTRNQTVLWIRWEKEDWWKQE